MYAMVYCTIPFCAAYWDLFLPLFWPSVQPSPKRRSVSSLNIIGLCGYVVLFMGQMSALWQQYQRQTRFCFTPHYSHRTCIIKTLCQVTLSSENLEVLDFGLESLCIISCLIKAGSHLVEVMPSATQWLMDNTVGAKSALFTCFGFESNR